LLNLGTLLGGTGGSLDFAGGSVVHINSGVSALAASLILGKRHKDERGEGMD
jgi:Amt family ammonium transporter